MEVVTLNAELRDRLGRHRLASLRAEGLVPVVVYGGSTEPVHLQVAEHEIEQHMRKHHKVFHAKFDGKSESVLMHSVQQEPTSDRVVHIDFLRIDLTKPVHLEVELTWLGHPVGLAKGGRLVHDMSDLQITCLPTAIPESIEINVADLDVGMSIHAKDVVLPKGVELDVDPEAVVAHVVLQVEAPAAPAAVEGEAAAPAAAAPAPEKDKK